MQETIKKIKEYIASGVFPGASFATIDENITHRYYLGNQQVKPYQKFTRPNSIYDLASVSKVVGVGTIIIRDYFRGNIDIYKSLKDYYPAFHDDKLKVVEFLTHTSGVDPYIENRDSLNAQELKQAMNNIRITSDKRFKYTDVNFLLLGFMLEEIYGKNLKDIIHEEVFVPFEMSETSYGPVENAVLTSLDIPRGQIHDPKARLLGVHAGSAGIFSSLVDLEKFVRNYLFNESYFSDNIEKLDENFSMQNKERSLAWDLRNGWLLHTGYTGTFILINLKKKKAIIFLSNRVHLKDERAKWIEDRDLLIDIMIDEL
ncbi:serine hydrolase domain-containing protein [Floricoccus penangensis]|uniref:serine hydrolase domain-containing protein n=1 Tax=Floricoccus penangensis TaxID=1859475 RepID=UPI00203BA75E|nr:serine hydrolase domain-containing protein [Floricoccus penangensis]URZ87018.1 beta-lactamase family protein [Floricoccus penangensis]